MAARPRRQPGRKTEAVVGAEIPDEPLTWQDFLIAVRKAKAELGNPEIIWYRGQSREKYLLTPSLLRWPDGPQKEQALFNEYERSASRLQAKRDNDWELLIDMQHYGIPTRLLDWTDVLGVAIAFALYDSRDDNENSVIYVLNPLGLNSLSGLREIKRAPNDREFDYKSVYWHGRPFMANHPIAIDSTLQNSRLLAQNGSFTVHGRTPAPVDKQAPKFARKILMKPSVKPAAREFLEHANLNAFSIYPDIVGMARHIKGKYFPTE